MTGYDILLFLEEIWYDILNPGQADIVSLVFRILAVFIAFAVVWGLGQYIVTSTYRIIVEPFRKIRLPRLPRRRQKPPPQPDNTYYEEMRAKQEAEAAEREARRQEELDRVLTAIEIKKD